MLGDPDQLRQLLANLTRNAVIHTPAGTPVALSVDRRGDEVVLVVRDHGPGLPADVGAGAVRTVLAQRGRAQPRARRRRARPGDRRRDRPRPPRHDLRRRRARGRRPVRRHAPRRAVDPSGDATATWRERAAQALLRKRSARSQATLSGRADSRSEMTATKWRRERRLPTRGPRARPGVPRRRPAWYLIALAAVGVAAAVLGILQIGSPTSTARTAKEIVTAERGVVQSTVTGSATSSRRSTTRSASRPVGPCSTCTSSRATTSSRGSCWRRSTQPPRRTPSIRPSRS